ncbi:unnamed protein product [Boreogadus saida]
MHHFPRAPPQHPPQWVSCRENMRHVVNISQHAEHRMAVMSRYRSAACEARVGASGFVAVPEFCGRVVAYDVYGVALVRAPPADIARRCTAHSAW